MATDEPPETGIRMKNTPVSAFSKDSKYYPLHTHMVAAKGNLYKLSFCEVEAILGCRLPEGARSHRAWWGNSTSGHSQSRAWLLAGWRVTQIDVTSETVHFTR